MIEDNTDKVVEEATLAQMVTLVGTDRIGEFLDMLANRVAGLGDLGAVVVSGRAGLTEVHKVISEAGILGFAPLSKACRAFEDAVKSGHGVDDAADGARKAMADALAEIARRRESVA